MGILFPVTSLSRLPKISGRDCVKALTKTGFHLKRQHGSHMILRRNDPFAQLVVPNHKELDIDFHINNFTALSVGDILFVLSPPSGLVKLII
jgi:predicted RNA binding protein YcfA (HicA-like mRNA interferase family)